MKGYVKKGIRDVKGFLNRHWKNVFIVSGICIVVLLFVAMGVRAEESFSDIETWDDQRATLWPLLASMVVTMLGSLITTYVFLKEALDRTVDEKPYYGVVIHEYRSKIMRHLWWYSVATFMLMALVIIMYTVLYFWNIRISKRIRMIVVVLYGLSMVYSGVVLRKCININAGLFSVVKKLIKRRAEEFRKFAESKSDVNIREIHRQIAGDKERMEQWLQVEPLNTFHYGVGKKEFVNRFSEWERFLMLLVEEGQGALKQKPLDERIKAAVLDGMKIFEANDIERQDAESNGWSEGAYKKIKTYQESQYISKDEFCKIAILLSEYRDLLKVEMEIDPNETVMFYAEDGSEELAGLFAFFVLELSINVFRILPKIEIFLPAGRFQCVNFYNTRFENSAFRSASFTDSVFSRSKLFNSNFGMALFKDCEFFSVDSRNCSLSNVKFDSCSLKEAIFEDVDFTGTYLENCDLEKAVFHECIFSNMEVKGVKFYQNNFTNSKIWNILSYDVREQKLQECNFSDSDLYNIRFYVSKETRRMTGWKKEYTLENRKYLEFLGREDIADFFWSKQGGNADIWTAVKDFKLGGGFFRGDRLQGKMGEKKTSKEKSIWSCIEEEAVMLFQESVFKNAKMRDAKFYRVNLDQSIFSQADMKEAYLLSVHMSGSILDGANLRESLFWAVNLQNAVLTDAILFKTMCKMVNFEDAGLRNLHASKAKICYCSFERSDCSCIDLTKAQVSDSSFRDVILTNAELTDARFQSVDFENCIADGMLSAYSIFNECTLRNAYLRESCFNYTVFRACDFGMANFNDSTVTNVEFHDCNFEESNFRGTCFVNAYFSGNMQMTPEIFEGCRFIRPRFAGSDTSFEESLKNLGIVIIK